MLYNTTKNKDRRKNMYKADLHLHTKVSDGSEDIEEILDMAKYMGITHLSITNHDTTQRTEEYIEKAKKQGIQAIPGVEMSAYDSQAGVRAHILGYNYIGVSHIEKIGAETLRKRTENGYRYIEVLNKIGYRADLKEIEKLTTSAIYKQHILAYLMKTGQTDEIFGDVYYKEFKNGGPCSFDVEYPDAVACVRAICADGGIAVLAHPGQQNNFALLPKLVEAGLKGIEYNHPSHHEEHRRKVREEAEKFGLFMTGGSDFHGLYEKTKTTLGAYPAHESSRVLFEK